jgi:hypothetical protein
MATRKPTKLKTSADYKAEIERTKQKLADLEKLAVAGEIGEIIKNANIVATYTKIKEQLKDTSDVAIFNYSNLRMLEHHYSKLTATKAVDGLA